MLDHARPFIFKVWFPGTELRPSQGFYQLSYLPSSHHHTQFILNIGKEQMLTQRSSDVTASLTAPGVHQVANITHHRQKGPARDKGRYFS